MIQGVKFWEVHADVIVEYGFGFGNIINSSLYVQLKFFYRQYILISYHIAPKNGPIIWTAKSNMVPCRFAPDSESAIILYSAVHTWRKKEIID